MNSDRFADGREYGLGGSIVRGVMDDEVGLKAFALDFPLGGIAM